jgi:hypothetical protein
VAEWTKVTGTSGKQGQSGIKPEETMANTKTEFAPRNIAKAETETGFFDYFRHLPAAVFRT